ncbi:hypothetical protein BJ741DRAFT_590640 [Chytriomyces cf. hyalinus JEL632]|nr:hypothetical protein BJ741DRAFT_590640 [Chytriomyces cf. hyalinus JEL632]
MQASDVLALVTSALAATTNIAKNFSQRYGGANGKYGSICGHGNDLLAAPFCNTGLQCVSFGHPAGNRCTTQSSFHEPCAQALQYPPVCAPGLQCVKTKKKVNGQVGAATGKCVKAGCGSIGDGCNANKPCANGLMCSVTGTGSLGTCQEQPAIMCLAILPCPPGFSYWCPAGCQPDCPFY